MTDQNAAAGPPNLYNFDITCQKPKGAPVKYQSGAFFVEMKLCKAPGFNIILCHGIRCKTGVQDRSRPVIQRIGSRIIPKRRAISATPCSKRQARKRVKDSFSFPHRETEMWKTRLPRGSNQSQSCTAKDRLTRLHLQRPITHMTILR